MQVWKRAIGAIPHLIVATIFVVIAAGIGQADPPPIPTAAPSSPPDVGPILASGEWTFDAPDISVVARRTTVSHSHRAPRAAGAPHPEIVGIANTALGVPYVHGGSSLSGFDCSGFVSWAYAQIGISLPHTTSGIRSRGVPVSSPQPGDVIYTSGHVGIYVSPGWQIDAPRPGKAVQLRPIWQSHPTYLRMG